MERSSGRYLQLFRGGAKLLTRNQLGKVRQKRQALQDMARPLKQWLYKHRDNPYPTKTEKILLALGSHMTLVQVSNWFANARRRLKNTVRQPDLSWALRIKLYNKYVQGNAERLSVSSDETPSDDSKQLSPMPSSHFSRASHDTAIQDCKELEPSKNFSISDEVVSHPKYKNSLLNRYLNDSLRHVMASENLLDSQKRNHSASFQNFPCHTVTLDHGRESMAHNRGSHRNNETYWKELHATMFLTNMAEVKETSEACTSSSIISTSISSSRNSINSSSSSPLITTSCIIQKSSHIAEIKTVRMGTFTNHVIEDGLSGDC